MFSQSLLCDMEWKSIASKKNQEKNKATTNNNKQQQHNKTKQLRASTHETDLARLNGAFHQFILLRSGVEKKKKKKQYNWIFHHFTTSEKNEMLKKARTIVTSLHLKLCINLQEDTYVKFPLERVIKASTLLTLKFLCTYSRISLLSIMYLFFT